MKQTAQKCQDMKTYKDLSSKQIQVSEQFPRQIFYFEDQNQIIPKLLQ